MYRIAKLLDDDMIAELLSYYDDETSIVKEGDVDMDGVGTKTDYRVVDLVSVSPNFFNEVSEAIEDFVNDDTEVNQIEILSYQVGGQYRKHRDTFKGREEYRVWTTVTMLDKSDDLKGGTLTIEDCEPLDLEIGQTVVFNSDYLHQADTIEVGYRKVLVCWLGYKHYKYT